jgi:quinol monooxygenase YgiN
MIHVIASIRLKPGTRSGFLDIFNRNIPEVRKEAGCIAYFPAVDIDSGLPAQDLDENMVTIIETWESVKSLQDHLAAPHMLAYREKVKEMVASLSLKVLGEVVPEVR